MTYISCLILLLCSFSFFFFLNDTALTDIYTLSLHDALPIFIVKSRASRLVLAFYRSVEHAEEALQEVRKNHFRRSGVVHCAQDGRLRILYAGFSPYSRAAAGIVLAFLLILLGQVLRADQWEQILLALSGFLMTWFGTLWLGLGIQKKILQHYGRFILPSESLVIVQETEARTTDIIAVLRRIAHPSVFAIRPGLQSTCSRQPDETPHQSVTIADLPACASELSASHELDTTTRSRSLLPVLRQFEEAIERART